MNNIDFKFALDMRYNSVLGSYRRLREFRNEADKLGTCPHSAIHAGDRNRRGNNSSKGEELSRERSRLRNASLSSSSTQQELVQRAISVLCNRQMKSNSYIKKMRFADTSSGDNIEKHENYASDLRNVLSLG